MVSEESREVADKDYYEFVKSHANEVKRRVLAEIAKNRAGAAQNTKEYLFEQILIGSGIIACNINKKEWHDARYAIILEIIDWLEVYQTLEPDAADLHQLAKEVLSMVALDIEHQFEKFGAQRLDMANWCMVIAEERFEAISELRVGEFIKKYFEAKAEIRQVIACLIRLSAEITREERGLAARERAWYVQAQ